MLQRTAAANEFDGAVRGEIQYIVTEECERLRRHIQDLLNVSRVEQGIKLHLNLSRFEFGAMMRRVVEHDGALDRLHRLEVDLPEDLPRILGDEERLAVVTANLINNALRYSPDGGLITVKAYTLNDTVRVEVSDQGMGIAAEDTDEVFRKFARLKHADERVRGGRGIGLFISKFFIEAHGGRIGVQSKVGEGSTFWFWIPIEAQALQTNGNNG
jgi:signal transduction histidine kinase